MPVNFPTSIDSLTNPTGADTLATTPHSTLHSDERDAIEALEAKVGANSSAVTTSHDYKLGRVTGSDKAVSTGDIADFGLIIAASGSRADVQAALDTAKAASLAANGPIKVIVSDPGTHTWSRGVAVDGTSGARVPGIVLEIAGGVTITKDTVGWATDNYLIQFSWCDNVHLCGNGTLDGGQVVVLGTQADINGLAADLVRMISCSRTLTENLRFQNTSDAWLHQFPQSADASPELSRHHVIRRCWVENCNQYSQTNSSGSPQGCDEVYILDNLFKNGQNVKIANRALGGNKIWHLNNSYENYVGPAAFNVNGPSDVISRGNYYSGCTTAAVQFISNNTNATVDYEFNNVRIDDKCYNCATGVVFKPDSQADTLLPDCRNVDIKIECEAMSSDTGFGIDLDGSFINLKAHVITADWTKGYPIRYNARGVGKRTNAHLIVEGSYDFTSNTGRDLITLTSDTLRSGQFAADSVTLDYRGVKAINATRAYLCTGGSFTPGTASGAQVNNAGYAIGDTTITLSSTGTGTLLAGDTIVVSGDNNEYVIATGDADVSNGGTIVLAAPGLRAAWTAVTHNINTVKKRRFIRNFKVVGDVQGFLSSGLQFMQTEVIENVIFDGFIYIGLSSVGLDLQQCVGGYVRNCYINAPSSPLRIRSSCGGVRYSNNALLAAGVPTTVLDEQGPLMASASKTSTFVDVTVTHGLGTDFTVPAGAAKMFAYYDASGVEVAITAIARTSSTVFRLTFSGSAVTGTLVCFQDRHYSFLNGNGFGDQGDRIYDNLAEVNAQLCGGTVAVA